MLHESREIAPIAIQKGNLKTRVLISLELPVFPVIPQSPNEMSNCEAIEKSRFFLSH